jgi:hypothetical protein
LIMSTLSKEYRRQLESTVLKARDEAERGAAAALESYGVAEAKLPAHLDDAGKNLRRKLRAHGRQVGDVRRPDESQEVEHLIHECAYEHWHRMLFARFLAENGFLIEPESGLDVDFAHCEEEAKRLGIDPWELASRFAQKMFPGIFRPDDPVLQLRLPAESRNGLTVLLASLPREVFLADDSLGWVYQFWQAERKKEISKSEVPRGADEIAPVTQLFTEDYMVEFLLHNTLGAWWAGRLAAVSSDQFSVTSCPTEEEARKACSLPGVDWKYLRFVRKDGKWTPAAGTFPGWPKAVRELRALDPCMGSGHFLVFALAILVRMRMEEEGLSAADACMAVLRENLFGLELDPRCTQIAAFNLALAAWKLGGYQKDLSLNLACSGLGLHAKKEDWLKLAERAAQTNALAPESDLLGTREETLLSQKLKAGMERLYQLFQKAPVLGSLINPRSLGGDLLMAEFHDLQPLLAEALQRETGDEAHELAVTAQGVAKAAEILSGYYTLVGTNVPYLGIRKQCETLKEYATTYYSDAKEDFATVFCARISHWLKDTTMAVVTPQNWFYQFRYRHHRISVLENESIRLIARLGEGGFQSSEAAGALAALSIINCTKPTEDSVIQVIDASEPRLPEEKATVLESGAIKQVAQKSQLSNPDARLSLERPNTERLLNEFVTTAQGIKTGDDPFWVRCFWEISQHRRQWRFYQTSSEINKPYAARSLVINWATNGDGMVRPRTDSPVVGKSGVVASAMREISVTLYNGDLHYSLATPLIPVNPDHLPAIWTYCSSPEYNKAVREIEQNIAVTTDTLAKVPFDLAHWLKVAAEKYPDGLPKPFSSDPTQWLFNGHPKGSDYPLQVAVARLVGYRWPRQAGLDFPDCPALEPDELERHADNDGVVCFSQARDEAPAAQRLRALLADAYGAEWNHAMERKLIAATGSKAESLEEWLVTDFFEQHCDIFHNRPFVWHIWDGRKDGFNVLVNYHKLASAEGGGARTLETLTYAYLGDWIARQKDAVAHGEAGADDRLAAALELQGELKNIVAGEPPYDLFIRWKPLDRQPIGWEADINDGVRLNIRPFMVATLSRGRAGCGLFRAKPGSSLKWDKDRGNEPSRSKEDFPWFWKWDEQTVDFAGGAKFNSKRWNDCHYTTAFKKAARDKKANK